MEVESPADGTLMGISAGPGQVVPVGQPIAISGSRGRDVACPGKRTRAARRAQLARELKAEVPPSTR